MKAATATSIPSRTLNSRSPLYEHVTNTIIRELERGVRPWVAPWSRDTSAAQISRPLRFNNLPYQGINILILWSQAIERGFAAPVWMTFKQALNLGGHVRKGERGTEIVFASKITWTTEQSDGSDLEHVIPFLKSYRVFNVEQIVDLPPRFYPSAPQHINPVDRIWHADRFIQATGAKIVNVGQVASYSPATDHIRIPPIECFRDAESYYATLTHELTHWTRHPDRLNRSFDRKRFGDEGYAMEELVAELGSAFICADLNLAPAAVYADNASYLASWLSVLKRDTRAIFFAASHAQRAADFLNSLQPQSDAPADGTGQDPHCL